MRTASGALAIPLDIETCEASQSVQLIVGESSRTTAWAFSYQQARALACALMQQANLIEQAPSRRNGIDGTDLGGFQ